MSNLYKYRYLYAIAILLATFFAAFSLPDLVVNNHFEQFLSSADPEYSYYRNIQKELEDDSNLLFLALTNSPDIYDPSFLKRTDALLSRLDSVTQLKTVSGLTRSKYPVRSMLGIMTLPYLHFSEKDAPSELKRKIERDPLFVANYTNQERTALLIYLEFERDLSQDQVEDGLESISSLLKQWEGGTAFIWGKHYVKNALDKVSRSEMTRNLGLGFLCLGIVLFFILRRWLGVIAIFGVILSTIIIYYGLLAFLGIPTNLMTNLVPTIILISGISDLIHLSVRAQKSFEDGETIGVIYSSTLREVGRAIFITSLTTALGFFSLLLTTIPVLQHFGMQAGTGVLLTFGMVILLFPVVLSFNGKPLLELRPVFTAFSSRLLDKLAHTSTSRPGMVVLGLLLFMILAVFGIGRINTNNSQYSLPDSGELRQNHAFFENEFGGSRTLELYVRVRKGQSMLDPKIFNKLNKAHTYLDSLPYLSRVSSPLSFYNILRSQYRSSNNQGEYSLAEIRRYTSSLSKWPSSRFLINRDKTLIKFRGQMKDEGRKNVEAAYFDIESEVQNRLGVDRAEVRVNGLDFLYDRTHSERIKHMILGILTAILLVTIVLGYLFKNIPLALLALILNLIPMLIGAGVMGFTNLELRAGTSIVFTVAFVIAVDDTIHLLSKYRWERRSGRNLDEAIQASLKQCGSAILATSLILVAAFVVLISSSLGEIAAFGFLSAVMIVLAFVLDILLLPVLLRYTGRS